MTGTVYNKIRRFLFKIVGTISLDRNDREVTNLLFVLPGLYLNILKTEKILQFCDTSFQKEFESRNKLLIIRINIRIRKI